MTSEFPNLTARRPAGATLDFPTRTAPRRERHWISQLVQLARSNVFVDYSPNLRSIARAVNREHSPIDLPVWSGLCTSFRVYSSEHDQRVSAEDSAQSYGWPASVSTGSVEKHLEDLLGEAQALPCAATAQWALVLAVGRL